MNSSDISSAFDAMFFGFTVSCTLMGITLVQSVVYVCENQDRWPLRSFVVALVLLDLAETCCSTQILRYYLIISFGDVTVWSTSTNIVAIDCAIIVLTKFMVHVFFASRVSILDKSWWHSGILLLLSIAALVLGSSIVPLHTERNYLRNPSLPIRIQIASFHSLAAFTDFTKTLLRGLLVYSVSRGILILLLQVGHIIMYLLRPAALPFWISLHFCMCKIYVITTLFILNARSSHRGQLNDVGSRNSMPTSRVIRNSTDGGVDAVSESGSKSQKA